MSSRSRPPTDAITARTLTRREQLTLGEKVKLFEIAIAELEQVVASAEATIADLRQLIANIQALEGHR